jgi:glutamate N-acetyltransferase/amino-acid N-acetyltransferase
VTVVETGLDVGGVGDAAAAYLAGDRLEITCDLGLGAGTARVLATDLGHGYIEENMRTS